MERLIVLRLQAQGCVAEAHLNGIPILRTGSQGGHLSAPVHEYLSEGDNMLALVVHPAQPGTRLAPRQALGAVAAKVRLLVPRAGQAASEHTARCLGELDWAVPDGEVFYPPVTEQRTIQLPVKLPRWRWWDAPAIAQPAQVQEVVGQFVQSLAVSLAKGDPEPFLQAARVRFEDLAVAYQQPVADLAARWRSRIQLLFATQALRPVLPAVDEVVLRPCAEGRMVECVSATGEPSLRTLPAPDGTQHAWPIRVAVLDGRCLILR